MHLDTENVIYQNYYYLGHVIWIQLCILGAKLPKYHEKKKMDKGQESLSDHASKK